MPKHSKYFDKIGSTKSVELSEETFSDLNGAYQLLAAIADDLKVEVRVTEGKYGKYLDAGVLTAIKTAYLG